MDNDRYHEFCNVVKDSSLRSQLKAPKDERPWYALCVEDVAVFTEMFPTAEQQTEAIRYIERILVGVAGAVKSVTK